MDQSSRDLESEVIDLTGCSLEDLRDHGIDALGSYVDIFLRQVYRPRGNFGDHNPPGRAD